MISLHERYITVTTADGREESLSALDASRMENVEFVEFRPLSADGDQAAVDAWLERANYITEDLRWLLKLPYDRFWCQLIFDSSLHRCIDSYLNEACRPHDVTSTTVPSDVTCCLKSLHRLFFLVCLRSSTHHESPTNFIDGKVFGDILYENYIFDIPRLMDICVVYGHGSDAALVSKMIGNIFQQQPKYTDDLYTVVPSIEQVFDTLCSKCGVPVEADLNTPPKLTSDLQPSLESLPASEFEDIVTYLSDVAHTLNSFLKVYPSGSSAFWNRQSFLLHLATAYECFAVVIPEAFQKRKQDSEKHAALKKQFRRSQVCLLRIFRLIVYHVCLRPVADGGTDEDEIARGIEGYLDVMNAVLGEKHFIAHMHVLFPFDGDRAIISQSSYLVDEPRLQYIEDAFSSAATEHTRKQQQKLDASFAVVERNSDYSSEQIDFDLPDEDVGLSDVAGANLDSMISAVHDLLPEFGRGFVELCLEEFDCNVEKVVNALLENNLPPNLQGVDRALENAHDTSAGVSDNSASLLSQRRNIYDGDEFDVFSRSDIDLGRVYQGKHDKSNVDDGGLDADIRARSAAYALQQVTLSTDDDADGVWEYDDEYDDTYDSNVVGADDADSADEMMSRRPFVVPRIFADRFSGRNSAERNNYEEEEEGDENETVVKPPCDAFIEDPAVLRQRREQQWASRQQRRHGGNDRGAEAGRSSEATISNSGRTHDVKGAARGQGQSADVLRNRAWKEKNKASRVHHNRKDLADRKRRV